MNLLCKTEQAALKFKLSVFQEYLLCLESAAGTGMQMILQISVKQALMGF